MRCAVSYIRELPAIGDPPPKVILLCHSTFTSLASCLAGFVAGLLFLFATPSSLVPGHSFCFETTKK